MNGRRLSVVLDGWYPRLSYPYVLCGFASATIVDLRLGAVIWRSKGRAYPAGWLDPTTAVITEDAGEPQEARRAYAVKVPEGTETPIFDLRPMGNSTVATTGGIVWANSSGLYVNGQQVLSGRFLPQSPRVGVPGAVVAVREEAGYPHVLLWQGTVVSQYTPKTENSHVRIPGAGGLVAMGYFGPVVVAMRGGELDQTITPYRREGPPLILASPAGPWSVRATEHPDLGAGVLSGPFESPEVVQIWNMPAVWVDAQVVDETTIVIASSGARGELSIAEHSLGERRAPVPAPKPPAKPPIPDPVGTLIPDVRPYVFGEPATWPRVDANGVGMHCHRYDDNSFAFVKFGNPEKFERWGVADGFVWHIEDHVGEEGQPGRGEAYAFSDGRWLPLACKVGDTINATNNFMRWYRKAGAPPDSWQPYAYRMTVKAHYRAYPVGGDVGVADVLVFTYDPGGDADTIEEYWCANGHGWFAWYELDQRTGTRKGGGAWITKGGPSPVPVKGRAAWPKEQGLTRVTIAEPGVWPVEVTDGEAVRCVFTFTGPRPDRVRWRAETPARRIEVDNPGWDPDHTFRGLKPGTYLISLTALDQAGRVLDRTGRRRELRVRAAAPAPTPTPEPPVYPDPLPGWRPSRQEVYRWRGNFLAFPGFEFAFMYPAWTAEKQAAFRRAYRAAGYTHLPIGIWGEYPSRGEFDFRRDVAGCRRLLSDLLADGLIPCVFLHTDAVDGRPYARTDLEAFVREYVPQIRDLVPCWSTGWEFPQIDSGWSGWWTKLGGEHLKFARVVRGLIGAEGILYAHFPPERITGWPDYHDYTGPQDESAWWKEGGDVFDGLLYQRAPEEEERFTIAHTIGGPDEQGGTDVGDARRIAGGYWGIHKRFVLFEFARNQNRHARISAAVMESPYVDGYC